MYLKALIWVLVTFLLCTFGMAGIGFWQVFELNYFYFIVSLGIYLALLGAVIGLLIKVIYFTKIEINELVEKVQKVINGLVEYFKGLSSNPKELFKVILKILKSIKK